MANETTTVVLGIPIPSTNPIFLAMIESSSVRACSSDHWGDSDAEQKGRGRDSTAGTIYFWFLFGVFVTMSALSFMRWAENYHLFILGLLSFASALLGRTAVSGSGTNGPGCISLAWARPIFHANCVLRG